MKVRLIGIGNPGRRDDGLGRALVDRFHRDGHPPGWDLAVEWKYQLNIEDSQAIQDADMVIFADATAEEGESARLSEIAPAAEIGLTTHAMAPESVLALAEELYGRAPKAFVLAMRGYAWDIGEGLSPQAAANLDEAFALLLDFLRNRVFL
jgi:hydrogenase maturation protease